MKYGGFKYTNLNNIGDHIQSLAAEQFLTNVSVRINRDTISNYVGTEPVMMIMNGWFSHDPETCFPPSSDIHCIYWGYHITSYNNSWEYIAKPDSLAHLKAHEPIGCRDRFTTEKLKTMGIISFYSKCLTLTFPHRGKLSSKGYSFLVDVDQIDIPECLHKNSIKISHFVPNNLPEKVKFIYARYLINLYKEQAKLVITTKLHCALPCIAMGIPVVFFGNENDYRISVLKDIGVEINPLPIGHNIPSVNHCKEVIWNPKPIDFEEEKIGMIKLLKEMLNRKINSIGFTS